MDIENPMQTDIPVATLVALEVIGEQIEEPKSLNACAAKICNGIKIFAFALVAISVVGGILVYVLYI